MVFDTRGLKLMPPHREKSLGRFRMYGRACRSATAALNTTNRTKVIRVTVYLASEENDQFLQRSWVGGCVRRI